jgi:hypothetical protein
MSRRILFPAGALSALGACCVLSAMASCAPGNGNGSDDADPGSPSALAEGLVIGAPTSVRLDLETSTNAVTLREIFAGGRSWLSTPSPLFEVAVGPCIWTSNTQGPGPNGEMKTVTSATYRSFTSITARLSGCTASNGFTELTLVLTLAPVSTGGGQVVMTGTIQNTSPGAARDGWIGPFVLGDRPVGQSPVFAPDAHVAAVRSRANLPYRCVPGDAGSCARSPGGLREDAFVIGFDGIVYGSSESENGAWSVPTATLDVNTPANRGVFQSGGALAGLRRNDAQSDLFSVGSGGYLTTIYRVDGANGNAWVGPTEMRPNPTGPRPAGFPSFVPGAPVAALSVHEEYNQHVNEVEVYAAGLDGRIYGTHESNDGPWSTPAPLFTPTSSSCTAPRGAVHVAAVARNHRQRDLFFIDKLGQLCTAFRFRNTQVPPDTYNLPWGAIPLTPPGMFSPGAPVAVAHGPGNSELAFAIRASDAKLIPITETDDGAWTVGVPIPGTGVNMATYSSISAARRTAREVAVLVAQTNGHVLALRSENGQWLPPTDIAALPSSTPNRKVVLSLRSATQLDAFGVAGNGDNRLWTSGDGLGRVDVRLVYPKLAFAPTDLAAARGMVPMEISGSATLKHQTCVDAGGCVLGMPYHGDPRAQFEGLPQSMNMMEIVHVAKNNASLYVFDGSPAPETGQAPTQFTAFDREIAGFWTKDLWPRAPASPLPTVVFGGYPNDDWHGAASAYAAAHAALDPPPVAVTPDWLRRAGAIYSFAGGGAGGIYLDLPNASLDTYANRIPNGHTFGKVIATMRTEAAALGTDVLYLNDYWGKNSPSPAAATCENNSSAPYFCKGDYLIRDDFREPGDLAPGAGERSLRAAVDTAHQQPNPARVILYVEPFVVGFGTDVMNQFGDLYGARDPGGAMWQPFGALPPPENVNCNAREDSGEPRPERCSEFQESLSLSYAHSGWTDRVVQTCVRLITQTHADGIFLDSAGWRLNERVETKDEVVRASPLEHMRAFLDLADRVRQAIRAIPGRSDAVVMTENMGGPVPRHVDGSVSSDLSTTLFRIHDAFDGHIVATPTRFGRKSANIFSNGTSLREMNEVFAAGHGLALANNWPTNAAPALAFIQNSAAYIKKLVILRRAHAMALVDGDQTDLADSSVNLIARQYLGGGDRIVTLVNTSTWGGTALGSVTIPVAPGTPFCDMVERRPYEVSAAGTINSINVPGATDACPETQVCGLRVLVQGPCP